MSTRVVTTAARTIAFYLPQFHPIPENDEWWGKGFTEWTNVAKARPLFRGHYQPHLPADLGFCDLRVSEVREAQADLARRHGIEGFCYWHYWFHGRRLLNRPFDEVRASGRPNFPFCLAWANESWCRSWSGDNKQILLEQTYSPEDDLRHARWLAEVFSDARYLRVQGRPLFIIYRPNSLPDCRRTTDTFRHECVRLGVAEPYIIGRDTHNPGMDMRPLGCDISEHAAPNLSVLPEAFDRRATLRALGRNVVQGILSARLRVYPYEYAVERMWQHRPQHPHVPECFVGWDNTARRGRDAIIIGVASPKALQRALARMITSLLDRPAEYRIVMLNAWNEWAEGMHLEPDHLHGLDHLRAVAEAVRAAAASASAGQEIV